MAKEVWALIELENGQLTNTARELCGVAQDLGQHLGALPAALVLGPVTEQAVEEAAGLGMIRVYRVESPAPLEYNSELYGDLLSSILQDQVPQVLLFSHGTMACEVAPWLGVRLERAVAVNCAGFQVGTDGSLAVQQFVHEGRAYVQMRLQGPPPYLIACRAQLFGLRAARPGCRAETVVLQPRLPVRTRRIRRRQLLAGQPQTVDITEADLVVAGGLGFKTKESLQLLWRLGDLLGASVGATRPLVDNGWLGLERQIGTTGRVISPKLYIAFGISGATQHTSGIVNPGAVIAVNTDAGAPIFQLADLGLVGDLEQVVPLVLQLLEEAQGGKRE